MGSWPVDIIRTKYPRIVRLYVESVSHSCEGEAKARVYCPYMCPVTDCRLWSKPHCALNAVLFIVPYPDDKEQPYRIAFEWERARDFALKLAREIREREETLYHFETEIRPHYDTSCPLPQ
jgi:hypothetical protein